MLDRGACGRRSLGAEHLDAGALARIEQGGQVAAWADQVGFEHLQRKAGGDSGIGLAAAKHFAGAGMKVCMADVVQDRLAAAANEVAALARGGEADVLAVALPDALKPRVLEQVLQQEPRINRVIAAGLVPVPDIERGELHVAQPPLGRRLPGQALRRGRLR